MKSTKQINISKGIQKLWDDKHDEIMKLREAHKDETSEKISMGVKQHYLMNNTHKKAISDAQKSKWVRIGKALDYCKKQGVDLDA